MENERAIQAKPRRIEKCGEKKSKKKETELECISFQKSMENEKINSHEMLARRDASRHKQNGSAARQKSTKCQELFCVENKNVWHLLHPPT